MAPRRRGWAQGIHQQRRNVALTQLHIRPHRLVVTFRPLRTSWVWRHARPLAHVHTHTRSTGDLKVHGQQRAPRLITWRARAAEPRQKRSQISSAMHACEFRVLPGTERFPGHGTSGATTGTASGEPGRLAALGVTLGVSFPFFLPPRLPSLFSSFFQSFTQRSFAYRTLHSLRPYSQGLAASAEMFVHP